MTEVEKQLDAARQQLLDLTLRNRLLNFRKTRRSTLTVIDEIPREIYDLLVLREKAMQFLHAPEVVEEEEAPAPEESDTEAGNPTEEETAPPLHPDSEVAVEEEEAPASEETTPHSEATTEEAPPASEDSDDGNLTEEEKAVLWGPTTEEAEPEEKHLDRYLQTDLPQAALQEQLFTIHQKARSVFEEQGYTVLYLALGFLKWFDAADADTPRMAPLVLVPVELNRRSVRGAFKVAWTGEDIFANISLQAKLSETGLSLPDLNMPEDKAEIDDYFHSVTDVISDRKGWEVVPDICLGFFSFTKFVMYKDLDPDSWPVERPLTDQDLLRGILDPSPAADTDGGFSEENIDEKLSARDAYHIMDADPSQIAVIEDIKAGRNLVVEGPPGTGKSQTIANVIAELLARGKRVLFVSEKMAALEVVKARLDRAGLGDFCLELHSRKSNKKEVLKELEKTTGSGARTYASPEEDFDRLEGLKRDLDDYAAALRDPCGDLGHSPFSLFGLREGVRCHFADSGRPMPAVDLRDPEQWTREDWSRARLRLENLRDALSMIGDVKAHPWYGCSPGVVLPSDEGPLRTLLEGCRKALADLEAAAIALVQACGARQPADLLAVAECLAAADVVADSSPVEQSLLSGPAWDEPDDSAETLMGEVRLFQKVHPDVAARFKAEALDEEVSALRAVYEDYASNWFRILSPRYREVKGKIRSLYQRRLPFRTATVLQDLADLERCASLRRGIRDAHPRGIEFFGALWQGEDSDVGALESFAVWITAFRKHVLSGVLTEEAVDRVAGGVDGETVRGHMMEVRTTRDPFEEEMHRLFTRVGAADVQKIFGSSLESAPFPDIASRLASWLEHLPGLQRWAQFTAARESCRETVAAPVDEVLEEEDIHIEAEDLLPCFEGGYAEQLLHRAFQERPALSGFVGDLHEKKIRDFADLDRRLIRMNQKRLAAKLSLERPAVRAGASAGSEAGILLGEFGRKRGHMPIRKLLTRAGGLITRIKPCFLMSPLSVAQFLAPGILEFDVVVFDEASQVRPSDALGAVARGGQVVVMGDTRQLPPTSFFDHILEADGDEEADEATVSDVESILHQCKRAFPMKMLRWHYRSRHESLIAFSNQAFYDNNLRIYPSPVQESEGLGLKFRHLPESVYDRGRTSVNRMEAREVARAALEHFRRHPEESLGVGAFNIKQQQAILEEVELQLRLHPDMESHFAPSRPEKFFVKNLETIQGDERDVIFLSVAFGFDADRKLYRNFGPLNQEGGERRLNVLVTRARKRCVVFSNFRAEDLSLDGIQARGARALKGYLGFAEKRILEEAEAARDDADFPFEESVHDCLEQEGIEAHRQVGCAGFRLDIGVVDPEQPGRFFLGVQFDGTKYHGSRVARDRDRQRRQVLEGLGWRLHRVWSTDWYRNRDETLDRLLGAIEASRIAPMPESDAPPAEEPPEEDSPVQDTQEEREEPVRDYSVCRDLGVTTTGELHDQSPVKISRAVTTVVNVEGPVHFNEILQRIRKAWDLKRAGRRIRALVSNAADLAEEDGCILRKGEFLWPSGMESPPVRRRGDEIPASIDLICDEEIEEAVKAVLRHQFATLPEDLVIQAGRVLGFASVRQRTEERIQAALADLLEGGTLVRQPNGMIGPPPRETS